VVKCTLRQKQYAPVQLSSWREPAAACADATQTPYECAASLQATSNSLANQTMATEHCKFRARHSLEGKALESSPVVYSLFMQAGINMYIVSGTDLRAQVLSAAPGNA